MQELQFAWKYFSDNCELWGEPTLSCVNTGRLKQDLVYINKAFQKSNSMLYFPRLISLSFSVLHWANQATGSPSTMWDCDTAFNFSHVITSPTWERRLISRKINCAKYPKHGYTIFLGYYCFNLMNPDNTKIYIFM